MLWKASILAALAALLLVASGCGESSEFGPGHHMSPAQMRSRMEQHRAIRMHRRAVMRARHRAMIARRHQWMMARHRAEMRRLHRQAAKRRAAAARRSASIEASECDPNYTGACLNPQATDYDCEGGSGNGPYYTGEVTVVGVDHFGLDADGDGIGCESE